MSNKTCRLCLFVVYPAITIRARITTPAILVCSLRVRKPSEININFLFFQCRWCPWWSLRARHNNNHRTILLFCLHFRKKPGLLCENFRYSTLPFSCYTRACNDHIASRDLFHFFLYFKAYAFLFRFASEHEWRSQFPNVLFATRCRRSAFVMGPFHSFKSKHYLL